MLKNGKSLDFKRFSGIEKSTVILSKLRWTYGGPEEIRTLDFYNANVALSQLSYRPVNPIIITRDG